MNLISASPTEDPVLQGVMLTHANLLYQLHNLKHFLQPQPKDASLSLLPPWHIYERSCGYFIYSCGMKQVCYVPVSSTIVSACTIGRSLHNPPVILPARTHPASDLLIASWVAVVRMRFAPAMQLCWGQCEPCVLLLTLHYAPA